MVLLKKKQLKWMIWGYPYFSKPIYIYVYICIYTDVSASFCVPNASEHHYKYSYVYTYIVCIFVCVKSCTFMCLGVSENGVFTNRKMFSNPRAQQCIVEIDQLSIGVGLLTMV